MNSIMIDDRDGSRNLIRYPPLDKLGYLCRLDSADIAFVGNGPSGALMVGVEVKSISDLLSSIGTGRLQGTQVPAMIGTYDVRWLLYHGLYRAGSDGRLEVRYGKGWRALKLAGRYVPITYLESFLLNLTAVGIHVRHVYDEREAATWISCLHRWWDKPWSAHKGLHAFDQSNNISLMPQMSEEVRLRASIAKELPGIGFERALAAANYFDSISEMINASVEDWKRVPGIGTVVAKAVVNAIHLRER